MYTPKMKFEWQVETTLLLKGAENCFESSNFSQCMLRLSNCQFHSISVSVLRELVIECIGTGFDILFSELVAFHRLGETILILVILEEVLK
jgi:hypothetical protein